MKQNAGLVALLIGIITLLFVVRMKYPIALPIHSFSWPETELPDPPIDALAVSNIVFNGVTNFALYGVKWTQPPFIDWKWRIPEQGPIEVAFYTNESRLLSISNGNWLALGHGSVVVRATDEQWALITNAFAK